MFAFHRRLVTLALTALILLLTGSARATDITTCGVIVGQGETGVLQNDLQCSSPAAGSSYGILLQGGATLDLNGHTLDHFSTQLAGGVYCSGKCIVHGPGMITSSTLGAGVQSFGRSRVTISDVDFQGQISGISVPFGRLELANVNISANSWGIVGRRVVLNDVSIALTAADPVACIEVDKGRVEGSNVSLTGCDLGIGFARRVSLAGLMLPDSLSIGVFSRRVELQDSSVTGSNGSNGPDILSKSRPVLTNTTCDHSARIIGGEITTEPWGVCAGD